MNESLDTRLILFGLWIALMLVFLLGDVIRIFAGDYEQGKIMGQKASQTMWLCIALLMTTPIIVSVLTLVLSQPQARVINIAAASVWAVFNGLSIHTYPGYYDRFLLLVSLGINVLIVWQAYIWA